MPRACQVAAQVSGKGRGAPCRRHCQRAEAPGRDGQQHSRRTRAARLAQRRQHDAGGHHQGKAARMSAAHRPHRARAPACHRRTCLHPCLTPDSRDRRSPVPFAAAPRCSLFSSQSVRPISFPALQVADLRFCGHGVLIPWRRSVQVPRPWFPGGRLAALVDGAAGAREDGSSVVEVVAASGGDPCSGLVADDFPDVPGPPGHVGGEERRVAPQQCPRGRRLRRPGQHLAGRRQQRGGHGGPVQRHPGGGCPVPPRPAERSQRSG